ANSWGSWGDVRGKPRGGEMWGQSTRVWAPGKSDRPVTWVSALWSRVVPRPVPLEIVFEDAGGVRNVSDAQRRPIGTDATIMTSRLRKFREQSGSVHGRPGRCERAAPPRAGEDTAARPLMDVTVHITSVSGGEREIRKDQQGVRRTVYQPSAR